MMNKEVNTFQILDVCEIYKVDSLLKEMVGNIE